MGLSVSGSGNLPVQLTRFFGRGSETVELEGVLAHARLVTLTGAPGSGKSRLAIEVAQRLAPGFGDGVRFVELAPVTDPTRVASAVGRALDIRERPRVSMVDTIADAIAEREVLLILDNCEHVADAAAALVERVVEACPSVRVLATSRLALGLAGEQVWAVAPLEAEPAVQLFIDRAELVSSDFRVDDAGREQIGWICDRLDGLPLAIELAAAWARVLSPSQIGERLDEALTRPATAAPTASPRQATMEATVDWSYRLLGPVEQRLFARLSVFAGGFDFAAAEAIAGADDEVLSGLTALVDHSLVQAEHAADGVMRYRMLEPLRQHAAEALAAHGERDRIERRHAEHYLEVARRWDVELRSDERASALRRFDQEAGNFQTALVRARTVCPDLTPRLCVALSLYWQLRGRVNDGRAWLDEALQVDTSDRRLRATMLSRAGVLAWRQSDYARAQQLLEDSLAIERELGDASSIARRLRSLSLVSMSAGEGRTAARLAEESLGIFREHNDQPGVLWALVFLGWARYACGEMSEGAEHLRQAVAAGRAVGAGAMTANALLGLAYRAAHAEDVAAHRAFLADALTEVRRVGGDTEEVTWLWIAAGLAANEGRFESALRLAGAADAWSRRHGGETAERFMISLEPLLERAGQAVGSDTADRLRAEGARMTWEELATAALAEPRRDAEEPLSRREREVVELVAGGMTNVEIAERLFISKRTVESHIDHIKQKLGFRSRSQVMAWALRESVGADRGVAGADPEGS